MHSRWLWPLHKFHHAATEMNILTTIRTHPTEIAIQLLGATALATVIGFPAEVVTTGSVFLAVLSTWQHSNVPWRWRWAERYVLHGAAGHRLHHSRDPRHFDRNFTDLVVWDRLFGTYWEADSLKIEIGVTDDDGIYNTAQPIRETFVVLRVWLGGLLSIGISRLRAASDRRATGPHARWLTS